MHLTWIVPVTEGIVATCKAHSLVANFQISKLVGQTCLLYYLKLTAPCNRYPGQQSQSHRKLRSPRLPINCSTVVCCTSIQAKDQTISLTSNGNLVDEDLKCDKMFDSTFCFPNHHLLSLGCNLQVQLLTNPQITCFT